MPAITAVATLAQRRAALTARTPRQIVVPLLTPVLFAVAIGTVGLLVPLTTIFAGLSVIVDRDTGAQRELLAAPVPRSLLVLGNLTVALSLSALQVAVLIGAATAYGDDFQTSATG